MTTDENGFDFGYDDEDTRVEDLSSVAEADRTPEARLVCRECGETMLVVREDWRPPESADAAWEGWHRACVKVGKLEQSWTFCRRTGGMWDEEGRRHDFERRKNPPHDPFEGNRRRPRGA